MPKGEWTEYFVFTGKERKAAFILLGFMVVFGFFAFWYKPAFTSPAIDAKVQQQLARISYRQNTGAGVDSLDEETGDSTKETYTAKTTGVVHWLFYFDPNTLDAEGLKKLGFGDKTVEHIIAYRKTGKFQKPEDLYNIPRIRKKTVEKVLPFVKIGAALTQQLKQPASPAAITPSVTSTAAPTAVHYKPVNINTAAAADFKAFPGVSDVVANRIIKFRTILKGFTNVDDVAKTYGLPDSSFKIMRPYLRLN